MTSSNQVQIKLPVSRVSQPIGDFYVGRIDARTLIKISYTEIRAFEAGTQEKIAGIQREKSEKRIAEIRRYVNLEYATFPTSVIIAVEDECAELNAHGDPKDGIFHLTLKPFGEEGDPGHIPLEQLAFIIDGQHRVAGLEGLKDGREFDVNVSIFVGASKADKAEIFARVNQAQTKVNQSLVVDLASFYEERGPLKFAHEIALALNQDPDGPLHDKIKRLGKAQPGKGHIQTLAQATVVKPIVDYITKDPEGERNKRYKGIFSSRRGQDEWERFIFQPFYDDDDAAGVYKNLKNYFAAIKDKWPTAWDDAAPGIILNRTTGYAALMRFLRPVYLANCSKGEILTYSDCKEVFDKISIEPKALNKDVYVPGSSGVGRLYRDLLEQSGLE